MIIQGVGVEIQRMPFHSIGRCKLVHQSAIDAHVQVFSFLAQAGKHQPAERPAAHFLPERTKSHFKGC